jgi:hypothetical protein
MGDGQWAMDEVSEGEEEILLVGGVHGCTDVDWALKLE